MGCTLILAGCYGVVGETMPLEGDGAAPARAGGRGGVGEASAIDAGRGGSSATTGTSGSTTSGTTGMGGSATGGSGTGGSTTGGSDAGGSRGGAGGSGGVDAGSRGGAAGSAGSAAGGASGSADAGGRGGTAGASGAGGAGGAAGTFGVPPTCTSMTNWTAGESPTMRPGDACKSCHNGTVTNPNFTIAGTVYPTAHEPTNCNGKNSVQVVITPASGTAITLTTNAAGNFYSTAKVTMPYTAKIVVGGAERPMMAAQTSGDCNSCHTQTGTQSAPGRIIVP